MSDPLSSLRYNGLVPMQKLSTSWGSSGNSPFGVRTDTANAYKKRVAESDRFIEKEYGAKIRGIEKERRVLERMLDARYEADKKSDSTAKTEKIVAHFYKKSLKR